MNNPKISPPPSNISIIKDDKRSNLIWIKWFIFLYEKIITVLINDTFSVVGMSTIERDKMNVKNGMIIYNSDTLLFEFYENGVWVNK